MTTLDPLVEENEEELWRLRHRVVAPPPSTTTEIAADLSRPPSSSTTSPRPPTRLKPPSLLLSSSSSTYRNDYKPSFLEVNKARSLGLAGVERGRALAAQTATAPTRGRSSSPPRDGDGGHCCRHCRPCCPSASSSPAPHPPPVNSLSPAKILSAASFDSNENAPRQKPQQRPLLLPQKQQQQNQNLQRASRVSGSALSDALAAFREKEYQWLSEKAAFRRESDAARRTSLLSEALRAKEATARRHAEAELKAARAALRRRDDDDAAERERHAAALSGAAVAAESRVRCAERAARLAACEAAEARERIIALEQELADERARLGGVQREREEAAERALSAVDASRRAAARAIAVVEREAERPSGAERGLRERVERVCGVDLNSIVEEDEEEEEDEDEDEEKEENEGENSSSSDEEGEKDDHETDGREARLAPISFTL